MGAEIVDPPIENPDRLDRVDEEQDAGLPAQLRQRWVRTYGTLSLEWLSDCHSLEDLGAHFGKGLYAREVTYLVAQEWALTVEDILWRRTKLGLHLAQIDTRALDAFIAETVARKPGRSPCPA